ncbi:MAG: class I SAM-dependent methyltransferase, partial [Deinococcota bacterium]
AADYDDDVRDEQNPIRTGYEACLTWVAEQAVLTADKTVLELGSGTGNLTTRLPTYKHLTCLDVSPKMMAVAKTKLDNLDNVKFVEADVLEYLHNSPDPVDVIVSTYTLHHLTKPEKETFLTLVKDSLNPGGRLVVGDLMVESEDDCQERIRHYQNLGNEDAAESLAEEFFWRLDSTIDVIERLELAYDLTQFSDLSYGLLVKKS